MEVASLLLEAGADKNLATEDGFTALMLASAYGRVGVVGLLLDAGADKDMAHPVGETSLMMASAGGSRSSVAGCQCRDGHSLQLWRRNCSDAGFYGRPRGSCLFAAKCWCRQGHSQP